MSRPGAVVLTPNLTGRDGISRLARLVSSSFDRPTVLALHEPAALTAFEGATVRGAEGQRATFVAAAVRAAGGGAGPLVVAVHLHLAPAALAFTARGASLTTILCGVEAWKPLTWIQRAAIDRADRVIAISAHTRDRFLASNPHFARRAIDVVHPGIRDAAALEATHDRSPSALIVGRMAADERYKGHDELIEAWRDVAQAVPGATLRIAGEGDDRRRLEDKAAALGVAGAVVFLGGLDEDRLAREYARCTVFAMPSRDEGFGFVYVEAMRAARPCIAVRGAAAEIIRDGETGLVIEAGDRAQLADALVRLLRDRADADRMGARGRDRFALEFTDLRFRERFTAAIGAREPALAR